MKSVIVLLILLLFSPVFAQTEADLNLLINWMEGSFNSEEQSQNDSDYFNISLEMKKIWKDRKDGYWLYVEQAVSQTKDKPYRQRIYYLFLEKGAIISEIYSIPDESKYVGGYKNPQLFDNLSPYSLSSRTGCAVIIQRFDENTFIGSTVKKNCTSNLRGASYATTEVKITKDSMISWDRGFNDKDEQVWGAVKGGYIFKKSN
jgi:hypothetical protein